MADEELKQLRSNADNLAKCLHALLERIELLEKSRREDGKEDDEALVERDSNDDGKEKYEQAIIEDNVTVDPVTGIKKRTVITERVLTTKTFHQLALDAPQVLPAVSNGRLLSPVYQSRAVEVDARQLAQIEVEVIAGQLVVTKVHPSSNHNIHPGDTITEINGSPTSSNTDLHNLSGHLTLTLVPAELYNAPPLKKGDVLQVMSSDAHWSQARKVNDLSRVGYVPTNIPMEKVAMMCPFGRRVLVLLGAVGVGRRTIKSMLLRNAPQYFTTVVPLTSRAPRKSEQEGREYHFCRKEEMLKLVREGRMIEWGELDDQLYGTSADSVRSAVRGGRMCVIDCAPQALAYLYNGEFMPFVVHIVPPPLEEFLQLEQLRHTRRPVDQLSKVCAQSDEIATGPNANQIHLTLINRNLDVTFKRLVDALESLRLDTQWVPESWMC